MRYYKKEIGTFVELISSLQEDSNSIEITAKEYFDIINNINVEKISNKESLVEEISF